MASKHASCMRGCAMPCSRKRHGDAHCGKADVDVVSRGTRRRIRGKRSIATEFSRLPIDSVEIMSDDDLVRGMEEACFDLYSDDDSAWCLYSADPGASGSNIWQGDPDAISISSEDEQPDPPALPSGPRRTTAELQAAHFGLHPISFKLLLLMGVPPILFNILWRLHVSPSFSDETNIEFIEVFAGIGNVHRFMQENAYSSCAFDVIYDPIYQDIMGDVGFVTLLQWLRRLRFANGGTHWAPVCSTWIWVARHNCGRSGVNVLGCHPLPDCVSLANKQVSRVALCLLLVIALQCTFVLEQPSSSLLAMHPRMLLVKNILRRYDSWFHIFTWLGAFGAETPKATRLFSNNAYVRSLHRTLSKPQKAALAQSRAQDTTSIGHERKAAGLSHVTGTAGLKPTQSYPAAYGAAHASAYRFSKAPNAILPLGLPVDVSPTSDDLWEDCDLSGIATLLKIPMDRWVL